MQIRWFIILSFLHHLQMRTNTNHPPGTLLGCSHLPRNNIWYKIQILFSVIRRLTCSNFSSNCFRFADLTPPSKYVASISYLHKKNVHNFVIDISTQFLKRYSKHLENQNKITENKEVYKKFQSLSHKQRESWRPNWIKRRISKTEKKKMKQRRETD